MFTLLGHVTNENSPSTNKLRKKVTFVCYQKEKNIGINEIRYFISIKVSFSDNFGNNKT